MRRRLPRKTFLAVAIAAALGSSLPAQAVSLNPNGLGQALIFPYYTVRTAGGGNAFNTYLSVVNTTTNAKAVRVRLREGRAGRPVLDFNLYLSPNDVWTGALVPTSDGARLLTTDTSCTDPAFTAGSGPSSLALHANAYTGTNADGFGDTLDRTREGYVEMIEMATLTGLSAASITHNSAGVPPNCAAVRPPTTNTAGAPTGGLSGTLTLINVNSGLDFTLDATALQDLSTRAFLYPPGDTNPSFASGEIDPVSVVVTDGRVYRSLWTRAQDAVSAVLMRSTWTGEYVLDNATASLTDFVVTLPTRHFYATASTFEPPFTASGAWNPVCTVGPVVSNGLGEELRGSVFNREEQGTIISDSCSLNCLRTRICAASGVASVRNAAIHQPTDVSRTGVLGSTTFGLGMLALQTNAGFQNGWIELQHNHAAGVLTSLPGSTRMEVATGAVSAGVHRHAGLPVVGFTVRTFNNGTLSCSGAGSCQGNYGGAFPLKYRRLIGTP